MRLLICILCMAAFFLGGSSISEMFNEECAYHLWTRNFMLILCQKLFVKLFICSIWRNYCLVIDFMKLIHKYIYTVREGKGWNCKVGSCLPQSSRCTYNIEFTKAGQYCLPTNILTALALPAEPPCGAFDHSYVHTCSLHLI